MSTLNIVSRSAGTKSSLVISSFKLCSLVFIFVLALVYLVRNDAGSTFASGFFEGTSTSPGSYAIALYSGLWAFDGWDACCVSRCVSLSLKQLECKTYNSLWLAR